ncbi:hypothetical protein HKD37_17G048586 [Glycine soja]
MRVGNSDIYGFLEPQSIQRSGQSQFESESYIKSWMQSSQRDVYIGAYLNGGHWQMVVILPKEHLVVWFCSLHNWPDNYLKGIINRVLMMLHSLNQRLLLGGLSSSVIDKKEVLSAATMRCTGCPPSLLCSYPLPPMVVNFFLTHLLLEVASPLSVPSPFHCHSSSKKQRNPLMKKILGLQAPMELTSCGIKSIFI